jgi:lipoprotein signal peptidase
MAKSSGWIVLGFFMLILAIKFWSQSRGVGFIFIGGLSNWLDRLQYGGVIDMFNGFVFWFNLADVFITFGVIVLIYETLHERKI